MKFNLVKINDIWINPNHIISVEPLKKTGNKFLCTRVCFINGAYLDFNQSPDVTAYAIEKGIEIIKENDGN